MIVAVTGLPRDDADLGAVAVVFVHGIGQQLQGQTLLAWAEPMARVADRIGREEGGGGVRIVESTLRGDGPSECILETGSAAAGTQRRLILSEARWADAFLAMSAEETSGWARRFALGATLRVARHLLRLTRPALASAFKLVELAVPPTTVMDSTYLVRLAALTAVSGVVLIRVAVIGVAVLALSVIAPVMLVLGFGGLALLVVARRLPVVGGRVAGLITALTSSVGDAGAWTTRPLRAAAMRGVVRAEVCRARTRVGVAGRVMVVAHSQGAAVAFDTLFGDDDPLASDVNVVATIGAGVSLLGAPRFQSTEPRFTPVSAWASMSPRPRWVNIWGMWDPVSAGPIGDTSLAARDRWRECFVVANTQKVAKNRADEALRSRRIRRAKMIGLVDSGIGESLVAAGMDADAIDREFERRGLTDPPDPIEPPSVALPTADITRGPSPTKLWPGPEEWPVHNEASLLTDHTTYVRNVVEVVEPLTRIALDIPEADVTLPSTNFARISVRSVKELGLSRMLAALCAVLLVAPVAQLLSGVPWLDGAISLVSRADEGAGDALRRYASGSARDWLEVSVIATGLYGLLLIAGRITWQHYRDAVTWRQETYFRRSLPFHSLLLAETLLVGFSITARFLTDDPTPGIDSIGTGLLATAAIIAGPWLAVLPARAPSRPLEEPLELR